MSPKRVAVVGAGQAVYVIAGLSFFQLLALRVDSEAIGAFSLSVSLASLIQGVVAGPVLSSAGLRYAVLARTTGTQTQFIAAAGVFLGRLWLGLIGAGIAGSAVAFVVHRPYAPLIAGAAVLALVTSLGTLCDSLIFAEDRVGRAAWHPAIASLARCASVIIAPIAWVRDPGFLVLSYVGVTVLVLLIQVSGALAGTWRQPIISVFRSTFSGSRSLPPGMLTYSMDLSIIGGANWIQLSAERWALASVAIADVGKFAVVHQLGFVGLSYVRDAVATSVMPRVYRLYDTLNVSGESTRLLLRFQLLIATVPLLVGALLLMLLPVMEPWVLALSPRMATPIQWSLVGWTIAGGAMFGAGRLLESTFEAQFATRRMVFVHFGAAVLSGVCAFLLVGRFGLAGAAYSSAFCGGVFLAAMLIGSISRQPKVR